MPCHVQLWRVKLNSIVILITYNVSGEREEVMKIILAGCESDPLKKPTVIMIVYIESYEL